MQTIYAQQAGSWSDNLGSGTWFDSPSGGNEVNGPTTLSDWDGDVVDLNGHQIQLNADITWYQRLTVQDSVGLNGTALTIGWGSYNTPTVYTGASLTLGATAGLYIVRDGGSLTVYGSLGIAGSLQCDWSGALLVGYDGNVDVQPGAYVNAGNGDPAQYFGWGNWGPPSSIIVDWGGDLFIDYAATVDVQEGQMTIASGGNLTVHGVLAANWYGSVNVNGGATIVSGGQLNLGGPLNGTLNVGEGGTCAIAGVMTVFNNGIISIDPAGTFAILPGATLDLDPAASLDFTVTLGAGVSPSDVRYGVADGQNTGTLHVPLPSQVLAGVPTDNTLGTLAQTAIITPAGSPIELQQYCSYTTARGNALQVPVPSGCPDLTGADVHLWIAAQQGGKPVMAPLIDISGCNVIGPTNAPTAITADVMSARTGSLSNYSPRAYAWCFIAYYPATGDELPITDWGDCTATPGIALTS
jgi:hypothetical protein